MRSFKTKKVALGATVIGILIILATSLAVGSWFGVEPGLSRSKQTAITDVPSKEAQTYVHGEQVSAVNDLKVANSDSLIDVTPSNQTQKFLEVTKSPGKASSLGNGIPANAITLTDRPVQSISADDAKILAQNNCKPVQSLMNPTNKSQTYNCIKTYLKKLGY